MPHIACLIQRGRQRPLPGQLPPDWPAEGRWHSGHALCSQPRSLQYLLVLIAAPFVIPVLLVAFVLGRRWWLLILVLRSWWWRLLVLRLRLLLCQQQPNGTNEIRWHTGHALLGQPPLSTADKTSA